MHADVKKRVIDAVDKLSAKGVAASHLAVHPDTAHELGLLATHLDLDSDAWAPSKEHMVVELMHEDYDRNPGRDDKGRPKTATEAAALAAPLCQAHLRRAGVKLAVSRDASVALDKLLITGKAISTQSEEV